MRIAVLSDAHGNAYGLAECLRQAKAQQAEGLFYLGDSFGYGRAGEQVVSQLRQEHAQCLLGNHDAMLLGLLPVDPKKSGAYRLPPLESVDRAVNAYLHTLLPYVQWEINGKRLLFVHGHPMDPLCGYLYPDTDKASLAQLPFDYIFCGHTHRPYLQRVGRVCIVGVGSCGLPRDKGTRLSFALYDSETDRCELAYCLADKTKMREAYAGADESVLRCLDRE